MPAVDSAAYDSVVSFLVDVNEGLVEISTASFEDINSNAGTPLVIIQDGEALPNDSLKYNVILTSVQIDSQSYTFSPFKIDSLKAKVLFDQLSYTSVTVMDKYALVEVIQAEFVAIENSQFANNTSPESRDIYLDGFSNFQVKNTTFTGNEGEKDQDNFEGFSNVVMLSCSEIIISNCSFSQNHNVEKGSSLVALGTELSVQTSTFSGNSAKLGAIYLDQGSSLMIEESE
jgi:hypothetical protein